MVTVTPSTSERLCSAASMHPWNCSSDCRKCKFRAEVEAAYERWKHKRWYRRLWRWMTNAEHEAGR